MNVNSIHFLFFIATPLSSLHAYSTETQNRIIENLKPNSITIIGEYHKKPESIQYFQELISRYFKQGKCLVVALEIASSQQQILDAIVVSNATSSSIKIAQMIDHPPIRTLLDDLARMKEKNIVCDWLLLMQNLCWESIVMNGWLKNYRIM